MIIKGGTFGPVATNTYVVFAERGGPAIAVDAPWGGIEWVDHTLARNDLTLEALYLTHGHWDHCVDAYRFAERGVPVWAGGGDEDWMADPAPFNPALFGNPPKRPGVTPDRVVGEGDTLEFGGLTLHMLHTPGHSPGCWTAWDKEHGEALVGDLIFAQGIGRTDFPRSSPRDMLASLERVMTEIPGDHRIYPGHGPCGVTMREAEPWARMFM